ncbi:MAG: YdjY domain-containing protein [Burkholderiaceae bacterium]|nr:YdjY domain-containing protein [Burkholderiaceae bacterium]
MKRRDGLVAVLGVLAATGMTELRAQAPAPLVGELKPLGQDRFQIGRIVVDKRAGAFTVPGRVHVVGKPLEYLATSPAGMKAYETLLELDTTGSEFNLACILIGLERDPKQVPWQQMRQAAHLAGRSIAISIAWTEAGKRRQVPAAEALLNPDAGVKPESVEWVYMGSPASDGLGRFAADDAGTLIGFVHDANSIIESRAGIGIGAYGSVRGHAMLPAAGSAVELVVEATTATP